MIYDIQSFLETLQSNLQHSLIKLQKWCKQNGLLLNAEKTKIMLITTRQKPIRLHEDLFNLTYNDIKLQLKTGDKILGVNVDQNLQWTYHFQYICKKISSYIWLLSKMHSYLTMEHRSLFYKAYIQPHFNYCNIVKGNSSNYNVSQITKLQRRVCKIILGTYVLSFDQNVLVNKARIMYYQVDMIWFRNVLKIFFSYEGTWYLIPHYHLSRIRIFISPNLI